MDGTRVTSDGTRVTGDGTRVASESADQRVTSGEGRPAVLRTVGLGVRYGENHALRDCELSILPGELVGLIGPNGAGKTTFIDAVTGFASADGQVLLNGVDLTGLPPHVRARRGLARTWQGIDLFEELTVAENMTVTERAGMLTAIRGAIAARHRATDVAGRALSMVGIEALAHLRPDELSQGQRKLVGVARALASDSALVLLDEPAAGLDNEESLELGRRLRQVVATGVPMLLVDHDMGLVMDVCDHVYVLDCGEVIAHGPPAAVRTNPRVIDAYLGGSTSGGSPADAPPRAQTRPRPTPASASASQPVLALRGMTSGYSGAAVVRNLDLYANDGEVVALLGANGAGKTTTLKTISGLVRPMAGSVQFLGRDVASTAPQLLARAGMAHVPEGRGVLTQLTVAEHFRLGYRGERLELDSVLGYFPKLDELRNRRAGLLSGGEQQMLALAWALARRPRLLLVDELSLGLAPIIVEQLLPIVREIANNTGAAVLLVEQHYDLALGMADRAVVMAHGEKVLEGNAADLLERRELIEASYLGETV